MSRDIPPKIESASGETKPAFDTATALDDGNFLKFLDTAEVNLDYSDSDYSEKMEGYFTAFKNSEEVRVRLIKALREKFKTDTGVVLTDKDFENISNEVAREAIENPEALASKLEVLKKYESLPGEIATTEAEIKKLGGLDELKSKRDSLDRSHDTLELASRVSFFDGLRGKRERPVRNKDFWNEFRDRISDKHSDSLMLMDLFRQLYLDGREFENPRVLIGVLVQEFKMRNPQDIFDDFNNKFKETSVGSRKVKDFGRHEIAGFVGDFIQVNEELEKEADNKNKDSEQLDAYDLTKRVALKGAKGFLDRWKTRLALPGMIKSQLTSVEVELQKLDKQIEGLEGLTEKADVLKENFALARESLLGLSKSSADLVEKVREQVKRRFESSLNGKDTDGKKPINREQGLKEAKAMLDKFAVGDEDYLSLEDTYLDERRAKIQEGFEAIVEGEVDEILNGIKVDHGAYKKASRSIISFLSKRGHEIGEKTGDDAKEVIKSVLQKKMKEGGFGKAKKILIEEVLREQGIRLNE